MLPHRLYSRSLASCDCWKYDVFRFIMFDVYITIYLQTILAWYNTEAFILPTLTIVNNAQPRRLYPNISNNVLISWKYLTLPNLSGVAKIWKPTIHLRRGLSYGIYIYIYCSSILTMTLTFHKYICACNVLRIAHWKSFNKIKAS